MYVSVTYSVDKDLYHGSGTEHEISLVTTEYQYGNELLAHVLISSNLGARLNERIGNLREGAVVQNELFFAMKTYSTDNPKKITRSTFDVKMNRFDMNRTAVSREILEEYDYTDKNGQPGSVKIVLLDSFDATTATIDFEDTEQIKQFPCPDWLTELKQPSEQAT